MSTPLATTITKATHDRTAGTAEVWYFPAADGTLLAATFSRVIGSWVVAETENGQAVRCSASSPMRAKVEVFQLG